MSFEITYHTPDEPTGDARSEPHDAATIRYGDGKQGGTYKIGVQYRPAGEGHPLPYWEIRSQVPPPGASLAPPSGRSGSFQQAVDSAHAQALPVARQLSGRSPAPAPAKPGPPGFVPVVDGLIVSPNDPRLRR